MLCRFTRARSAFSVSISTSRCPVQAEAMMCCANKPSKLDLRLCANIIDGEQLLEWSVKGGVQFILTARVGRKTRLRGKA